MIAATHSFDLPSHQWGIYAPGHQVRANLLVHIVAVPVFLLASIALVFALVFGAWWIAGAALAALGASLAAQGRSHRLEPIAPEPFNGMANAITRLLVEQWITFPRFVLSGSWWRAWRRSESR